MFGSASFASSSFGELEYVVDTIEKAEMLPMDAKDALKDFVSENFGCLWEKAIELSDLECPEHLLEYWELFIEYMK